MKNAIKLSTLKSDNLVFNRAFAEMNREIIKMDKKGFPWWLEAIIQLFAVAVSTALFALPFCFH